MDDAVFKEINSVATVKSANDHAFKIAQIAAAYFIVMLIFVGASPIIGWIVNIFFVSLFGRSFREAYGEKLKYADGPSIRITQMETVQKLLDL